MSINNVVVLRAKDEKRENFIEIMKESKIKLQAYDGCLSVRIYIDEKDPNTFVLIEEWESKGQHNQYFAALIESGDWEIMAEHLASDPDSRYCTEL